MDGTLMRRANLGSLMGDTDATYIRTAERSGRISYHRIGVGRRASRVGAKAQQTATRLACAIWTLSPDAANALLALPPRQVGRIVKGLLRRARRTSHKRVFCLSPYRGGYASRK